MVDTLAFSVVIPLYNKEKHIQRAIRSVLAQTCQDFELIIVDDGSTDASYEMASAIQDPRIRIIRQENQGVSAARNRGVAEAQYDWVAFLDADDEWLPEFLQQMAHLITEFPDCGVYGCPAYTFDGKNTYKFITSVKNFPIGWQGVFDVYFNFVKELLPYNASSIVIEKRKFIEVGGFPLGVKYLEDTELTTHLALLYPAAYLNIPLVIYHLESDNRSKFNLGDLESLISKWQKLEIQNQIPEKYRFAFEEFVTRYRLRAIRRYIAEGKINSARAMLDDIGNSRLYDSEVEKLRRRARFPWLVDKLLLLLKDISLRTYKWLADYLGME